MEGYKKAQNNLTFEDILKDVEPIIQQEKQDESNSPNNLTQTQTQTHKQIQIAQEQKQEIKIQDQEVIAEAEKKVKAEKKKLKKKKSSIKQIIFCRHGLTEEAKKNIILGQKGGKLSQRGIEEAEKVGKYLKKAKIDVAFVSDLDRCKQAYNKINEQLRDKTENMIEEPLLRDIRLGKFQGTSVLTEKTYYLLKAMNRDKTKKPTNKDESWADVEQRGVTFWKDFSENYLKNDNEDIRQFLVLSHKGIITLLLENIYLSDIDVDDNIKFFNMPLNNGEIIIMQTEFVEGKLRMIDFQRRTC